MFKTLIDLLVTIVDVPLFALWRASGWAWDNELPKIDKFMLVMAPHTSFMDYFHSVPVAIRERRRPRIMMKKELLQNPLYGWFLKLGGGFGVDRGKSSNAVQTIIDDINKESRLVMIIAPEGTREKTSDWKTGFYRIAVGAELPLVLVYINYKRKRVGFSEVHHPTGDIIKDYQWMSDFFAEHGSGRYPDQFALPDIDALQSRLVSHDQQAETVASHEELSMVTPLS